MIKILHILHSFYIGGMENGLVNIINRSNPDMFDHQICCLKTSGDSAKKLDKRITIYEMHKTPGNTLRLIPKLVRLIKQIRPDIVHTRNWGSFDGVIAAILAGVPVIHGEHGWNNIDDLHGKHWKRALIRKAVSPFISQFIAVSIDIQHWLIEKIGIPPAKVTAIINGVDTDKYQPGGSRIKHDYQLQNKIVIGGVGRLVPIKRFDLLINAFCQLNHEQYHTNMIIIGNGPEYDRLKNLIEQSPCADKIHLLGEHLDIHRLYALMDIFVLVSFNEGISNTILEAMACGLPVIATNAGGNRELVQSGKTGYLINGNSSELISTIEQYLAHPELRKLHGDNGRKSVEQHYSLELMVSKYEALYQSVFHQRKQLSE